MAAAHFQHGRTLEALGRVPDAVPPLRSAVAAAQSAGGSAARDSDYPVALALALASIARHTEALEAFDSALSISALPDASGGMGPEGIWLNRGNSLHALGRLPEAAQSFREAVRAAPEMLEPTEALAATLAELLGDDATPEETAEAREVSDRAAEIAAGQEGEWRRELLNLPALRDFSGGVGSGAEGGELRMRMMDGVGLALGEVDGLASEAECAELMELARPALKPALVVSPNPRACAKLCQNLCCELGSC